MTKVMVQLRTGEARHYNELAAIGGCTLSRFNLGCVEADADRIDRAIHWLIAASQGMI
jgi:hypothetical protein